MRPVLTCAILISLSCNLSPQISRPLVRQKTQIRPRIPHSPILQTFPRSSGPIFSGTVLRVEHRNANSSTALATTEIRFRVDQAIRGVRKGQLLEIKEWAGLWQSGERYYPGERVLLFLYPPSKLGLTSPVAGRGRFPIDRSGRVILKLPVGSRPKPIEIRRVVSAIRGAQEE